MTIGNEDVVFEVGEDRWHLSKIVILTDVIHYMIRAYDSHTIASIVRNGLKSIVIISVGGYASYRFAQFISLLRREP